MYLVFFAFSQYHVLKLASAITTNRIVPEMSSHNQEIINHLNKEYNFEICRMSEEHSDGFNVQQATILSLEPNGFKVHITEGCWSVAKDCHENIERDTFVEFPHGQTATKRSDYKQIFRDLVLAMRERDEFAKPFLVSQKRDAPKKLLTQKKK